MRLFLDKSTFISVIEKFPNVKSSPETMITNSNEDNALYLFENTPYYDCQIMTLVHGIGMYPATIVDRDTVSCIVHEHPKLTETSRICKDFSEVAGFHQECLKQFL